jgi:hypothetical protein
MSKDLIKKTDLKYMEENGRFEIGFKTTLSCEDSYIKYHSWDTADDKEGSLKGNFTCEKW